MHAIERVSSGASAPVAPMDLQTLLGRTRAGDKKALPALAREFESLFLSQLLKEMRSTLEPGTMFGQDQGDIYGGLFDLYMGRHLAENGGVGLATALERQMKMTPVSSPTGSGPKERPKTPA